MSVNTNAVSCSAIKKHFACHQYVCALGVFVLAGQQCTQGRNDMPKHANTAFLGHAELKTLAGTKPDGFHTHFTCMCKFCARSHVSCRIQGMKVYTAHSLQSLHSSTENLPKLKKQLSRRDDIVNLHEHTHTLRCQVNCT